MTNKADEMRQVAENRRSQEEQSSRQKSAEILADSLVWYNVKLLATFSELPQKIEATAQNGMMNYWPSFSYADEHGLNLGPNVHVVPFDSQVKALSGYQAIADYCQENGFGLQLCNHYGNIGRNPFIQLRIDF